MALAGAKQRYARPFAELAFSSWLVLPLAILLGGFLASQFFHLTPRYVKLLFAISVLVGILRLPFHGTIALFMVLWTAPTFIFIGDTNVIFIGVMMVIWVVRRGVGSLPRRVRTPLDWAVPVYLALHVLSFINVANQDALQGALESMKFIVMGCILYFLVVDGLRTERHLALVLNALCVTVAFVDLTALVEYYFGYRLIPEWFIFAPAATDAAEVGGRAGGVFGSHGLLADFSAMNFYLLIMMGMRARSRTTKWCFYGLAALNVHIIALTANRGGAVIWLLGGLYFLWFNRRRVRWVQLVFLAPVAALFSGGLRPAESIFLRRVRVLDRLVNTQLVRGVPETRVEVWKRLVSHIPEHLWIGHGPYIELRRGAASGLYWPHNAYLFYLYTTGILGLFSWLWILLKTIWLSFPRGGVDIKNASLARATMTIFHVQVVMFAMSQMRGDHQRGNVYYYLMWILLAIATVGWRIDREEARGRVEDGVAGPRRPAAWEPVASP